MIPEIRKNEILKALREKNIVKLEELTLLLGVSSSTVRRDLKELEALGEISLLRGGAAQMRKDHYDKPVFQKVNYKAKEKDIIAKKAASLIHDGDYVYIDSGTTTTRILNHLNGKKITVVTSSTMIVQFLPIKNITCIILGGEVMDDLQSVVGPLTEKTLMEMHFDIAFLGINGYVKDEGIYTFDLRETKKKQIVQSVSKKTYVLADTSKNNKRGFSKIFDYDTCPIITEENSS